MKNQALYSSKDKSKKLKCRLLQFLFGALGVKLLFFCRMIFLSVMKVTFVFHELLLAFKPLQLPICKILNPISFSELIKSQTFLSNVSHDNLTMSLSLDNNGWWVFEYFK